MTPTTTARLLPLFGLLLVPLAAHADETSAAKHFDQGTSAYRRKDFVAAARAFEAAFQAAPAAQALHSAGLAWEMARDEPRAADDFMAALVHGGLAPAEAKEAKGHLLALQKKVARVFLKGPAGATASLAHAEGVALPATIHVRPGEHELRVRLADGETTTQKITAAAGASPTVEIAAPTPGPTAPAEASAGMPAGRVAGFVTLGVGAAAAGVAIGLGVAALGARDAFVESDLTDADARRRAATLRTATNATWVTAAVLGAAGVTLAIVAPGETRRGPAATLRLAPRGVDLRVTF